MYIFRNIQINYRIFEEKQPSGQWTATISSALTEAAESCDTDTHDCHDSGFAVRDVADLDSTDGQSVYMADVDMAYTPMSSASGRGAPDMNSSDASEQCVDIESLYRPSPTLNEIGISSSEIHLTIVEQIDLEHKRENDSIDSQHTVDTVVAGSEIHQSEDRNRPNLDEHMAHVIADDATQSNDPALFANKRIRTEMITFLLKSPCQPSDDFVFPFKDGRQFLRSWFRIQQENGQFLRRLWISYSVLLNRAFCLTCMLFGGHAAGSCWTINGYNGYKSRHGARDIQNHEISPRHREAEVSRFQFLCKGRIDQQLTNNRNAVIEQNRRVLFVAIKAMKYLASEMMALRGHASAGGKYIRLFEEFADFDPCAAAYLKKLRSIREQDNRKKPEVNFLSPLNTRRLLQSMQALVIQKIVRNVSKYKVFSLINDGTTDSSKKDAQAVLVRYVDETEDSKLRPVERLLSVFTTGQGLCDTSGQGLCESVVQCLNNYGLPCEWIIGQSYDGASNVRGKHTGLRTRIQAISERALYMRVKLID